MPIQKCGEVEKIQVVDEQKVAEMKEQLNKTGEVKQVEKPLPEKSDDPI